MQEAGFKAIGLDASYVLLETSPEMLAARISSLRQDGFDGWNVTVPHKEKVLPLLDWVDDEAIAAGSVNTVLNQNGRLLGYTTDGYGLEQAAMEAFGISFKDASIVFLGTGGAARAAAVYAARHGAKQLYLVNRTIQRAEALRETIAKAASRAAASVISLYDVAAIAEAASVCQMLFQCTSIGLRPGDEMPMPVDALPKSIAVMDMVYGQTQFRQNAARHGCRTADGIGMLLHQGCKAFEIWTGRKAPIQAMRNALA